MKCPDCLNMIAHNSEVQCKTCSQHGVDWKLASDELPDSDIDVMVALSDGVTVWIGHHDGEDWIVGDIARTVTYWADLPFHPKDIPCDRSL